MPWAPPVQRAVFCVIASQAFARTLYRLDFLRYRRDGGRAMQVKEILRVKGSRLLSIEPAGRAVDAVNTMAKENLGSLVVMEQGRMVGMLTFHELLCALALRGGALGELRVTDIMVRDPVTPSPALLPSRLAEHELVRGVWEGIDAAQAWDCHAHLVGAGDSGSGLFVNPRMESLLKPGQSARRLFFLNAGCAHAAPGNVDRAYVERMRNLIDGMRPGAKLLLYAFDRAYDERGAPDMERSAFYVPDSYARDTARRHPGYFEWAASIHPYRRDAVAALEKAKVEGARAVKWPPPATGVDPASRRGERSA